MTPKMMLRASLLLTIIFGLSTVHSNPSPGDVTRILNNLTVDYDRRVRPYYGEKPVDVQITMYFLRGLELSPKKMNWKAQLYFRQTWKDPRLEFDYPGMKFVTVGPETARKFWHPDSFFATSISTKLKSDENVFFRIGSDGTILTSVLVTNDDSCLMDLKYFPHDSQTCTMEIESYGYTARDISYKWQRGQDSVGLADNIQFDNYKVIGSKVSESHVYLTTGNYSRLVLEVEVKSITGFFCRQFYLPAIIFALVTWLTFWIPDSFKIFRGLGLLTSLISFSFMSFRTGCYLPKLDYSTRLEQYINTCLLLSLFALAEFIVVLFVKSRRQQNSTTQPEHNNAEYEKMDEETGKSIKKIKKLESCVCKSLKTVIGEYRSVPFNIDFISKIIYIAVFVSFNVWYWSSLP